MAAASLTTKHLRNSAALFGGDSGGTRLKYRIKTGCIQTPGGADGNNERHDRTNRPYGCRRQAHCHALPRAFQGLCSLWSPGATDAHADTLPLGSPPNRTRRCGLPVQAATGSLLSATEPVTRRRVPVMRRHAQIRHAHAIWDSISKKSSIPQPRARRNTARSATRLSTC